MNCRKCNEVLPDCAKYCLYCGAKQVLAQKRPYTRMRGNGSGTAYKRGRTWTASLTVGWNVIEKDGAPKAVPVKRTKGGFKTKRDALAHIPNLQATAPKPHNRTFAYYWEFWSQNAMLKLSDSKQSAYKIVYGKIGKWMYRPVNGTGVADLQAIVNEKSISYYTARDIKSLLSHLYKLAILDGVVYTNIALHITLPVCDEREPIPFNETEIKALWEDYANGNAFTGYLLIMIYSGMMPGELLKVEKSMILWDRQQIVGCGLKTKLRKTTPIVIADFAIPVLRDLCDASPTSKVLPLSCNKFYLRFRETMERLNFRPELKPYSCRHTTATAMALGNIAPSVIQKTMRHSKFTTTQRYIHPDTTDILVAVNRLRKSPENPVSVVGTVVGNPDFPPT